MDKYIIIQRFRVAFFLYVLKEQNNAHQDEFILSNTVKQSYYKYYSNVNYRFFKQKLNF